MPKVTEKLKKATIRNQACGSTFVAKVVFAGSSCNKRNHPTWRTSKGVLEGLVTGLELVLDFEYLVKL